MKTFVNLFFVLCLVFPALTFASDNLDALKCVGINFDLMKQKDGKPVSVFLSKEDQDSHLVFEGKIEGNNYSVIIEKSSGDVHGYINRSNGEMLSFSGGLHDNRFEFGAHRGLMIPVQSIALSCFIE